MTQTIYYKTVTIGGNKYRIITPTQMTNEKFAEKVNYIRRVIGYALYPRWAATRMLLLSTYDMLRKRGIMKHRVNHAAKILNKEFDAFERLHVMDFDEDWIEVMSGSLSAQVADKVNALRGAIGGVLMNNGIKNYAFYSYPETVVIMCQENVDRYNSLMREVREKFKMNFADVFIRLRGNKVLACAYSLMSAIEDAVGEPLPMGLDATESSANVAMHSLENALFDDRILHKAFSEAQEECEERDFKEDNIAEILSQKFKVKRL